MLSFNKKKIVCKLIKGFVGLLKIKKLFCIYLIDLLYFKRQLIVNLKADHRK